MKLNERNIRNVVRRVLNEMEQNNDLITSYNDFLQSESNWTYDGNQLLYEEDNFRIAIPCPIEDVQNGSDRAVEDFDIDSFVAKSWLEGNIPYNVSRYDSHLTDLYEYVEHQIGYWFLCFVSPSKYASYLEDEAYEGDDE